MSNSDAPGRGDGNQQPQGAQQIAVKQACTVLYNALPPLDAEWLRSQLEPLVGPASVEWASVPTAGASITGGVAQFGPHRIVMIAMDAPVRAEVLERTVGVSPMPEEQRFTMLNHRTAIRLLYTGEGETPLDQLTALYTAAGMLLSQAGLGIINERAALAQPADLLEALLPQLGQEPPPLPLWAGVVTFGEGEDPSGEPIRYLMRTYGMEQFGLPETGIHIADRSEADATYHLLINICLYMLENAPKLQLSPGHTIEFQERTYLFTQPDSAEGDEYTGPTGLLLLIAV